MRIASVIAASVLAVALLIGTTSYAALAETPLAGQSMTFTGQVQGVDVGQGVVVVRGPKQDNPPGVRTGQTSVIILLTKIFRIDKTTKISVSGNSKSNLADIKMGDPISVDFTTSPNGQMIAKSVSDSSNPPPKPPRSSY